jgi:ribosomal protein L7/L12
MQAVLGISDYVILAALIFLIGRAAASFRSGDDGVNATNARKLDAIMKHLGISELPASQPAVLTEAVRTLADAGHAIEATKRYREETGAGLQEAKGAIDAYRSRSNH